VVFVYWWTEINLSICHFSCLEWYLYLTN
jgi:hypothetical protein